ncbi:MAG: CPXCG motif-containing cysteine-rich protein [gamma proteobacterium endosymbiont of Lamellibrachia anaximandri]|nr:CPXCG motif-containing cysteine-rich protein [gamma proteobacterium endosymbiont of Lamellibrachia anaximandri]MBL3532220.1 CPXCG motif-containing cysteine-rich protein [gamma proteobacterium endosymbiont of Lamellibrachia anaximandri]MBL3600711.1 CPXCG motif-containing cysteine-rich protein [gamma proteobacterium endosymbiont of Lamellibrachia anaximandri]
MLALESRHIDCPYCGEMIEVQIDCSLDRQQYIEDCSVCCRPITLLVDIDGEEISLSTQRDDDC